MRDRIFSTRIYQELRTRKTLIADGENVAVIRLVEDYRKLRTAQMPFTNALGMSPASRRSLKGKALDDASGFDLVSAFAQAGEPDEAVEVAQLVRNSTPDDAAKTPAPVEEPEPGVTLVDTNGGVLVRGRVRRASQHDGHCDSHCPISHALCKGRARRFPVLASAVLGCRRIARPAGGKLDVEKVSSGRSGTRNASRRRMRTENDPAAA